MTKSKPPDIMKEIKGELEEIKRLLQKLLEEVIIVPPKNTEK
jgi:hypothetical protein